MTAPVPVTPTEAREAAKRALAEVLDYAAIVRQDAPSMKALDLLDALDRFVAALPAEPAADARLAAERTCTTMDHEHVPATVVGTYDDGDCVEPDTAYCDECAEALRDEFTASTRLSPAQPDPATVERARAEGREQGLREAEQAVRALADEGARLGWSWPHTVRRIRAALSSATPSAPEGTADRG